LLLLEGEIPGVVGSVLHFYAVAAYGLQHPDSMNYTAEALAGLRSSVADLLSGRATMGELRARTRRAANCSTRVTRRAGDPQVSWHRGSWPMTVADVCTADTFGAYDTRVEYADRVTRWARTVIATLDAEDGG
jgi:hypothetical protein